MKKLLAILLILCMTISLIACTGNTDNTVNAGNPGDDEIVGTGEAGFETGEITINKDELKRLKIAFTYYTFDDKLGGQFKASIQYLCDAFNCEAVFFETGQGDESIANLESVLAAGDIDGVISVGFDTARMEVAKKYNVPVALACGFPSVEEEARSLANYDLFLGGVVDDDYWAGRRCIEALYNAGCRNVTLSGLTAGFVKSHDQRAQAFRDFAATKADMNVLAESLSMGLWADDIATFNASFAELDGMMFTAISDGIYNALESERLTDGSVKVAGIDISSQTGAYFKNGVQVWTCGGQYATAMVGWAILYNYLSDGTRIIADTSAPIVRKYIEINSYEDYENYVKYVEAPLPTYDAQEIAEMIHSFNPDITYADYLAYADSYTLEDIIARHGDKIN